MKAILLCAGRGLRLKDLTGGEKPKCLIKVGNGAILDWQLDALGKAGIDKITIVTGFKAEMIRDHLRQDTRIEYINNDKYASTNILTSFRMALNSCDYAEDLVVMAGDVVFDSSILKDIIVYKGSDVLVAIDRKKIDEEAVKIMIKEESVVRFGKDIKIVDAHGQFLGLMKINANTIKEMKEVADRMIVSCGRIKAYLFDMLNTMIREYNKRIGYVDIEDCFWEEIDYKEDWKRANNNVRGSL